MNTAIQMAVVCKCPDMQPKFSSGHMPSSSQSLPAACRSGVRSQDCVCPRAWLSPPALLHADQVWQTPVCMQSCGTASLALGQTRSCECIDRHMLTGSCRNPKNASMHSTSTQPCSWVLLLMISSQDHLNRMRVTFQERQPQSPRLLLDSKCPHGPAQSCEESRSPYIPAADVRLISSRTIPHSSW